MSIDEFFAGQIAPTYRNIIQALGYIKARYSHLSLSEIQKFIAETYGAKP
jgi:hypothetical protein